MRVVVIPVLFGFLLAGSAIAGFASECYTHGWMDCAEENCLTEDNKQKCESGNCYKIERPEKDLDLENSKSFTIYKYNDRISDSS